MTARRPRSPEITDAERRVLNLLPDGLNSGQIATRLHLAESTVKSHLVAISERWGVHGRPAILVEAYRRGEFPLPEGPELVGLRAALREIARLAGTFAQPDGINPEVVITALRARLAADTRTTEEWQAQA